MKFRSLGGPTRRYFELLGDCISGRWIEANLSEAAFSRIADQELRKRPAHANVDVNDLLAWVAGSSNLPPQLDIDATFARPPLTVYSGPDFNIDVLFWTNSTTSIHQHGFSGVFAVVAGSSLHCRYGFDVKRTLSESLQVGALKLRHAKHLRAGDQHRISSGNRFIHSLFHLDNPSISLVIRTTASRVAGPQLTYLPPYIALDPFRNTQESLRTRQFLGLLTHLKDKRVWKFVERVIVARDFLTAWNVLMDLDLGEWPKSLVHYESRRAALLCLIADIHRLDASELEAVLDERRRIEHVVGLRAQVTNPEHRLFLALVLNLRSMTLVSAFVKQRFQNRHPVDTIVGWLRAMGNKTGINLDEHMLMMLDGMLRGRDLLGCLRPFVQAYGKDEVERNRSALIEMHGDLSQALLLRTLVAQKGNTSRKLITRKRRQLLSSPRA